METVAKQLPLTWSPMYRIFDTLHAPRSLAQRLDYVYHASFDDPSQEAAILAPMPGAETFEAQRRQVKVPADMPTELASLCMPLLSRDQEQHLFRKMNFRKHQATQSCRCNDTLKYLRRQTQTVEALLLNCNMRLLVSIAKRYVTRTHSFNELLSDGHVSLISAVQRFDFSRGNKFSTYASWVIMLNYVQSTKQENRHRMRYLTGHKDGFFEAAVDNRADEKACLTFAKQEEACVNRLINLLDFLEPRERQIVRQRFGLDDDAKHKSLATIGRQLGVTKECVRQLQLRAMKKLRNLAVANNVELP